MVGTVQLQTSLTIGQVYGLATCYLCKAGSSPELGLKCLTKRPQLIGHGRFIKELQAGLGIDASGTSQL